MHRAECAGMWEEFRLTFKHFKPALENAHIRDTDGESMISFWSSEKERSIRVFGRLRNSRIWGCSLWPSSAPTQASKQTVRSKMS